MRRAFVGFSSPVGYCYGAPASETRNDKQSSPSPVLTGGLGLIILYDEVWFACESLCPEKMRKLPYVRFLDQAYGGLEFPASIFKRETEQIRAHIESCNRTLSIKEQREFGDPVQILEAERAPFGDYACDNHTHALEAFGNNFGGNASLENLAVDLSIISRFPDLDLSIVLNGATSDYLRLDSLRPSGGIAAHELRNCAEGVLRFNALPEISDPLGAYHPIIEELREDALLQHFRLWMDDESNRLDNWTAAMINAEVDEALHQFRLRADRHLVKGKPVGDRVYELFKDSALKLIPGLSSAFKWMKGSQDEEDAKAIRWQAFASTSRQKIERARALDLH
jgi:hypothetical protein